MPDLSDFAGRKLLPPRYILGLLDFVGRRLNLLLFAVAAVAVVAAVVSPLPQDSCLGLNY